ncbi:zinc-binding dehydrogenase [Streptomyces sp. NPDC012508]|uniref:zinc-dependent alcohol dehydrogenase n=1 Tax=Streptomyces sp. NPDC012508 TaxID=3364837 RepID=UPI00368C8E1B
MSRTPGGSGLAVVVDAPGQHRLVPQEPVPPGPGEALVRVYASGVCGSDREVYRGTRPEGFVRYPLTPGHEWSGTVAEVGAGVPGELVGRKVVGEGFRGCQVCERCHTGDTTLCTAGYDETGFTRPGAMAPTLTLPARLLHVLPDDADLTAAALLEPAACVAAATLAAAPRPGERVGVVGAGTLGLIAVQLLAASSPAELYVVEPRRERADLAREFGATAVVGAAEGAEGRCDLVLEAAGAPGSARAAVGLARRGGRVVLTGIPGAGATGLDPAALVTGRLTLHTVFGAPPAAWAHAVRAFEAGLLDLAALVTHELPLSAFPQAVELVGSGDPKAGKVLLRP